MYVDFNLGLLFIRICSTWGYKRNLLFSTQQQCDGGSLLISVVLVSFLENVISYSETSLSHLVAGPVCFQEKQILLTTGSMRPHCCRCSSLVCIPHWIINFARAGTVLFSFPVVSFMPGRVNYWIDMLSDTVEEMI